MRRFKVTTASDSVYILTERDNGTFGVKGENVASSVSYSLGNSEWDIFRPEPWPPVCGEAVRFVSSLVDQPSGTPYRMPGGGKITSPVRMVEPLETL